MTTRVRLALGLCLMLVLAAAARAEDYERWYTLEMAGQRAGYMHATQATGDGLITTASTVVFTMGRADAAVKITIEGTFVETPQGRPVSMTAVQTLANRPIRTHYSFGEGKVEVTADEAGQITRSTATPPEGPWLPPAAATDYVRQRLAAGAERIVLRTVEPVSGLKASTITRSGIRKVTITAMGRNVEGYECATVSDSAPGVESTEVIDPQGVPIRTRANLGGIAIDIVAATKEEATRAGGPGPELMLSTFVRPDKPIANAGALTSAVYLLSIPSGPMPRLPETAVQAVEPAGKRALRVSIRTEQLTPAPEADAADPRFTASTPMLKADDPEVAALAGRAVAGLAADSGPRQRAEAMRRFVHEYIHAKDLGVGFASASEVARSREGDCTEHAVLLAAMLRAVASGLIYADQFAGQKGIFGYHMWTQALLEVDGKPTWVDLDATLADPHFNATHITLALSALADGEVAGALGAIVPLLGRLRIQVVQAQ
jgi:hypothetical protein